MRVTLFYAPINWVVNDFDTVILQQNIENPRLQIFVIKVVFFQYSEFIHYYFSFIY